MTLSTWKLCPCGSGSSPADCCQPFLNGTHQAPTPEALMRSRYSAFCAGDAAYLLDTHKLDQPRSIMQEGLEATIKTTQWLGLEVLHSAMHGDEGEVEFVARYRDDRGLGQLRERSAFRREQGRWLYISGHHLPPPKPQRNGPCWCGSGKKLKKCCGA